MIARLTLFSGLRVTLPYAFEGKREFPFIMSRRTIVLVGSKPSVRSERIQYSHEIDVGTVQ